MFSALMRRKDGQPDIQEWLLRVTRSLLKEIEINVVKGADVELDWLHLRIGELEAKLDEDSSPDQIMEVADGAFEQLREYNIATTRHFHRHLAETESMLNLLSRTLQWAKDESDADSGRFQTLQQMLERVGATSDLGVMKSRLAESAAWVREEWTRQRRKNEQIVNQLQDEVRKVEAQRQREAGKPGSAAALPKNQAGKAGAAARPAGGTAPAAPGAPHKGAKAIPQPHATAPAGDDSEEDDPTTGLPGRRPAEQTLTRLLAAKRPLFAVVVAIDRLTMIEERYGEALRDEVLVHFGQEFAQSLAPGDQLFRWGKSSFLILMERNGSKEWIRMETERQFNVRYRKNVTANGRSVLLNVGPAWKMWSPSEIKSPEDLVRGISTYVKDR